MTPAETGISITSAGSGSDWWNVYIGRAAPRLGLLASEWANPFRLRKGATEEERAECLRRYREHVFATPDLVARLRRGDLLGKRLACWCKQEDEGAEPPAEPYCHGDVLRELQAELYRTPEERMPNENPEELPVIGINGVGERKEFPGCDSILKRIVYKERIGKTPDGKFVSVALAWNDGGPANVWFVCLIGVGYDVPVMKSCAQTRTSKSVKAVAEGWIRETGARLKALRGSGDFVAFKPKDRAALDAAILNAWPKGSKPEPDAAPALPPDANPAAKKNAEKAHQKAKKERAATPQNSLFDL